MFSILHDATSSSSQNVRPHVPSIAEGSKLCSYSTQSTVDLFLVMFAVLMTWQVSVSVMKYYSYPVKIQMLYKNAGQVVFPAVTICNLNPLRVSVLCDDGIMSGFKEVK